MNLFIKSFYINLKFDVGSFSPPYSWTGFECPGYFEVSSESEALRNVLILLFHVCVVVIRGKKKHEYRINNIT